VNEYEQLNAEH